MTRINVAVTLALIQLAITIALFSMTLRLGHTIDTLTANIAALAAIVAKLP